MSQKRSSQVVHICCPKHASSNIIKMLHYIFCWRLAFLNHDSERKPGKCVLVTEVGGYRNTYKQLWQVLFIFKMGSDPAVFTHKNDHSYISGNTHKGFSSVRLKWVHLTFLAFNYSKAFKREQVKQMTFRWINWFSSKVILYKTYRNVHSDDR